MIWVKVSAPQSPVGEEAACPGEDVVSLHNRSWSALPGPALGADLQTAYCPSQAICQYAFSAELTDCHSPPVLTSLHWLPVTFRIQFEVLRLLVAPSTRPWTHKGRVSLWASRPDCRALSHWVWQLSHLFRIFKTHLKTYLYGQALCLVLSVFKFHRNHSCSSFLATRSYVRLYLTLRFVFYYSKAICEFVCEKHHTNECYLLTDLMISKQTRHFIRYSVQLLVDTDC